MTVWSPQSPILRHRLQVRIRCRPSTVVASASRRRRRRLRPLPWSWDSDSEPDGPAQADGDLPVTVLASPRALLSAGLLPEHQFPISGTKISQSRVLSVPEDVLDALESDLAVQTRTGQLKCSQ